VGLWGIKLKEVFAKGEKEVNWNAYVGKKRTGELSSGRGRSDERGGGRHSLRGEEGILRRRM